MLNQFQQPFVGIDTGVVNAYVVSTSQHETSYYTGMPLTFYTLHANTTTAPTLNLNGLGAATIKNADGTALLSGQLQANVPIQLAYNTNDSSWRLVSPLGMPTSLTPSRALATDPSGRVAVAAPSLVQLNMLQNWSNAIQTNIGAGWTINPQGLIMQWGSNGFSTAGASISFPIAFPNACIGVTATVETASSSNLASNGYVGVGNFSATGFKGYTVVGTPACFWIALGY